MRLEDERFAVLRVLYEQARDHEWLGVPEPLGQETITIRAKIDPKRFELVRWQLGIQIKSSSEHPSKYFITPDGIVAYEAWISNRKKTKRDRKMEWVRIFLPAVLAAVLALLGKRLFEHHTAESTTQPQFSKQAISPQPDTLQHPNIEGTQSH